MDLMLKLRSTAFLALSTPMVTAKSGVLLLLVKPAIPMAAQPQQQPSQSKEEIVTQNDEEAPSLEKPKNTKPKQEKPAEEPKPTVNQRALFKGNNNPQAGGSEGITGQPGDQGNPNGLADIKKYDGNGGKGNGPGYDLGGRGAKSLHRPNDDFSEEGIQKF